ncbi:MAG: hypothetical protein ABR912_03160 [Terracidiphilus sp.]|jgi:hypothetical protein
MKDGFAAGKIREHAFELGRGGERGFQLPQPRFGRGFADRFAGAGRNQLILHQMQPDEIRPRGRILEVQAGRRHRLFAQRCPAIGLGSDRVARRTRHVAARLLLAHREDQFHGKQDNAVCQPIFEAEWEALGRGLLGDRRGAAYRFIPGYSF